MVLIGGTHYAGEMKKPFSPSWVFYCPNKASYPCTAQPIWASKATLRLFRLERNRQNNAVGWYETPPNRRWRTWLSDGGIFNIEGGCYAKCIKLSCENEPQIWGAIGFGTVLENVVLDQQTGVVDCDSGHLTENTRAAYPVDHIDNVAIPGVGGHPRTVIFLTVDAFGVLPPIAKLNNEQAMYHFLSVIPVNLLEQKEAFTIRKQPFPLASVRRFCRCRRWFTPKCSVKVKAA